jgi:hypothetical protein
MTFPPLPLTAKPWPAAEDGVVDSLGTSYNFSVGAQLQVLVVVPAGRAGDEGAGKYDREPGRWWREGMLRRGEDRWWSSSSSSSSRPPPHEEEDDAIELKDGRERGIDDDVSGSPVEWACECLRDDVDDEADEFAPCPPP